MKTGKVSAEETKVCFVFQDEEDFSEVMNDPAFLQSVLEGLPGVDTESEAIKTAMGALTSKQDSDKKEKKEDKKKEDKEKK